MTAEKDTGTALRPWPSLSKDEQLNLRLAYQTAMESMPPTCSIETKTARFAQFLESRGVAFSMDDLRRPKKP